MIKLHSMPTAHPRIPHDGKVLHSMQCLAFPSHQIRRTPARRRSNLRSGQDILKNEGLPMRSRHVRVLPKKVVRPLDSQLRQRGLAREPLSQAMPMTDQIIERPQKTQQIRPQLGSRVTHRGRVIPELGESFDGVEPREIGRTFDLPFAQLHLKVPVRFIEVVLHLTQ
jgi:hypothetical protein